MRLRLETLFLILSLAICTLFIGQAAKLTCRIPTAS